MRLGNTAQAKPGRGHRKVGIGPASVDVTPLARAISDRVVQGHGVVAANFLSKDALPFLGRAGSDALNLPKNAAIGLYEAGAAGVEAAQGDTRRGERLIRGLDDGVLGELAHGDVKGAAKVFSEHPLYGLLEVTGAGQVAGRGAGIGMRAGLAGKAGRRAASTKRAALTVVPGQSVDRSYSPNVLVKAVQVASEAADRRRGQDPNLATNRPLGRVAGAVRGHATRDRGALLNDAVDEFAAQAEGLRRRGRDETGRAAKKIAPSRGRVAGKSRAKAERGVVLAAVEGRLRGPKTLVADLRRERDRLDAVYQQEGKRWTRGARLANREQVKALDRALNDPKLDAEEIFRASREHKQAAGPVERDLVKQRVLEPDQATAAKVRPYAVAHMDARFDSTKRAPEEMRARHEEAKAKETTLRERVRTASDNVRHEQARRDRVVGANRAAAGKKYPTERARLVAAAERDGKLARADRAVKSARAERKRVEAQWKQARRDRVASNPKKYATGLVDADGKRITTAQILEHMRANDVELPGFVSHRRDTRGAKSFFVNWFDRRQSVDSQGTRTGEATRTGAHAADFRALEESLVRSQGVADAVKTFDRFAGQFGVRKPDGKPYTWSEAVRAAEEASDVNGMEMVPVRVVPSRYDKGRAGEILSKQGSVADETALGSMLTRRLDEMQTPPKPGERDVTVLMPKAQLDRFRDHQTKGSGVGAKLGQVGTSLFRGTVLPFSTKWIFGNVSEAAMRAAAHGVTPGDVVRGRRVMGELRKLDEQKFEEFDTRARGGLLFGGAERLAVHRGPEDFAGGVLETPANVVARLARAVDETLGKYGRLAPDTRRIVQSYAPFLPWFLNAGRFSFYALPAKHPAKAALLANIEQTFAREIEEQRKSAPPGSLQHGIRRKDGGIVDLARYSPFGVTTQGVEVLVEPLLPQLSSAVDILQGRSFTGQKLRQQSGEPVPDNKRLWLALYALLESSAPGIQIARRAQEGGATAFDDSTVWDPKTKPGTATSGAASRILNPLRPTYLAPPITQAKGNEPKSRAEQLLERRARLLEQAQGQRGSRMDELLERRAEILERARR